MSTERGLGSGNSWGSYFTSLYVFHFPVFTFFWRGCLYFTPLYVLHFFFFLFCLISLEYVTVNLVGISVGTFVRGV